MEDPFKNRGLLGIEFQALGGNETFVLKGVAFYARGFAQHPSFFHERLDHLMGRPAACGKVRNRDRPFCLLKTPDHAHLKGGAAFERLEFLGGNLPGHAGKLPQLVGDLRLPDHLGQDAAQGMLEGAAVVVRHPLAQPDQERAENRIRTDNRSDRLDPRSLGLV